MDLGAAAAMARELLDEHGLHDWSFGYDGALTRAGVTRYARRQVGLSRVLTELHDEAEVRRTLLHEVAHALAGAAAGHGPAWQAVARRLGCSPARCLPADAPRAPAPWVGTCPAGHTAEAYRSPRRVRSCAVCSPRFSPDALFTWTHEGRPAAMSAAYRAELAALPGTAGARRPPPPARVRPVLAVGTPVRVLARGRYAGATGVVERRGRTRYHVRTRHGLLAVPFAAVART